MGRPMREVGWGTGTVVLSLQLSLEHFQAVTFEQGVAYDATQERDLAAWQSARRAYKGVANPAKLVAEMPETHLGVVLTMWVKQVRKVGRRAAASRALIKTSEALSEQLATKGAALAEAERVKAEAEEAARVAAEEAARLAAEEAAAAAEGGEGGEEAAPADE